MLIGITQEAFVISPPLTTNGFWNENRSLWRASLETAAHTFECCITQTLGKTLLWSKAGDKSLEAGVLASKYCGGTVYPNRRLELALMKYKIIWESFPRLQCVAFVLNRSKLTRNLTQRFSVCLPVYTSQTSSKIKEWGGGEGFERLLPWSLATTNKADVLWLCKMNGVTVCVLLETLRIRMQAFQKTQTGTFSLSVFLKKNWENISANFMFLFSLSEDTWSHFSTWF